MVDVVLAVVMLALDVAWPARQFVEVIVPVDAGALVQRAAAVLVVDVEIHVVQLVRDVRVVVIVVVAIVDVVLDAQVVADVEAHVGLVV